jgi:hypothetical protein
METRLNEARRALQRREADRTSSPKTARLRKEDFQELAVLAGEIDRIFYAPTTTNRDRKEIMRRMVKRVVVESRDAEAVQIRVEWVDEGSATRLQLFMVRHAQRLIREMLTAGVTPGEIAERLNAQGLRTKYRTVWTPQNVKQSVHRILAKERNQKGGTKTEHRGRERERGGPLIVSS